jgi:hypothetical protein
VAGCCECGDEPSGSCATELVSLRPWMTYKVTLTNYQLLCFLPAGQLEFRSFYLKQTKNKFTF